MSEKLEIIIAGKDQFSGVFGKLQKALPSIKTLAVGASAAITGVGASLAAMTKSTAEAYDRVQKLSDQLGISTEFLSSLEHAADLSGIKIETMNKSVQSLQVRIGEAGRGVGQAKDAFDALGVSLQTSSGQLKTAEQIMPELADAFHNMTNATERAEAASKIFGQRGMSMIQMFKDGREGLAAMTEEAEKFGLVVSEKAGQNAAEFNDSLTRLTGAFTGVKNAIAEQSMEIFAGIANSLADFIANNRGKIAEFVNDIVKSGVTIYIGFKEVIEKVTRIFSMLTNKEGFEILVSNAKTALQAIGQLYLLAAPAYAETLLTVMKAAFEALVEIGRWAWENIKAAFTGADGPSLGDLVFDSLSRVVTERRGEIEAIWQGVAESAKPHFETLKTSIVNVLGDDVIETIRQKSAALSEAFSLGGTGEDGEPRGMPGLTDGDVEKSMENGQLFLEWYYEMLEEQRAAKQAFADFEEELEKKRLKDKLKREKEELKGRAKTLDAISGLQRTFHLEGFNLTKAAAIPETIMATMKVPSRRIRQWPEYL